MKIKLNKNQWQTIGRTAGWIKQSQDMGLQPESPLTSNNPLDGKSRQSASKYVYKIIGDLTKGFFRDEHWTQIHNIQNTLARAGINVLTEGTEYFKGEDGNVKGKRWKISIPFKNNTGKDISLQGFITADFGHSMPGKTDVYDVTFVVN